MKLFSFPALLFVLFFVVTACNNQQQSSQAGFDPDKVQDGKFKDGEQKINYPNGKLKYIVVYRNGKPNGQVKQFYDDGNLYMEATFKDGRRNGKCTYFSKNGKPFSVYTYVNGNREGEGIKYWPNGKVVSISIFKNDKVQPGLKEFYQDGTPVIFNTKIVITEVDRIALERKYYLKISLSDPKIDAKYYVSVLSEKAPRVLLPKSGKTGIYNVPIAGERFIMKKLVFDAEYQTSRGNTMRLQKSFNLAID